MLLMASCVGNNNNDKTMTTADNKSKNVYEKSKNVYDGTEIPKK